MNSSFSSPPKMTSSNQSLSDDSSMETDFDWESYLIETRSEAAPKANFRQSLVPPTNEFQVGEKLETVDPRNQDSWCIGTIQEIDGPRLKIRLDGTDDRNDFWRLVDSAEIRAHGATERLGGQIVPPLGFQLNSTRWARYFDKNVKQGPFAADSCFKTPPLRPEKNFFKKGQKLEAVDPKHPALICPATVSSVTPGDHRIVISLDGWSSSNNFRVDYWSRDIFPVGWCQSVGIQLNKLGGNPSGRSTQKSLLNTPTKLTSIASRNQPSNSKKVTSSPFSTDSSCSPTTMDEKNNNLIVERKPTNKRERSPSDLDDASNHNTKTEQNSNVTVFLNYNGYNGGISLNPQKIFNSMPTKFGPGNFCSVLKSIFDGCIKCSFQPNSFLNSIFEIFPTPDETKWSSFTSIQLENGQRIFFQNLSTVDEFWEILRSFQTGLVAGPDLFMTTPPLNNNQSFHSSSSHLDSSISPEKKEASPKQTVKVTQPQKRKSTDVLLNQTPNLLSVPKTGRSQSIEKSVHETRVAINSSSENIPKPSNPTVNGGLSRRPERYSPAEVAAFIRGIDSSFESLAERFLQEEIDGKALLLLKTDTLMNHMGLKLGPSLKIVDRIEKLKKS